MGDDLLPRLGDWARDTGILPKHFKCPFYDECNSSLQKKRLSLDGGRTCHMSYIGREYGQTFRIVLIGMEPVSEGDYFVYEDFAKCRKGIEEFFYGGKERFNPHYQGVIRTAAAALGDEGRYCGETCAPDRKCSGLSRGDQRCVLLAIAQANLVKCAPKKEDDNRDAAATPVMRLNCQRHLLHEIETLQPGLVVFHFADARWDVLESEGWNLMEVAEATEDSYGAVIKVLKTPNLECPLLFLHHPARNGLEKQWSGVVEPALRFLRARNLIPS